MFNNIKYVDNSFILYIYKIFYEIILILFLSICNYFFIRKINLHIQIQFVYF